MPTDQETRNELVRENRRLTLKRTVSLQVMFSSGMVAIDEPTVESMPWNTAPNFRRPGQVISTDIVDVTSQNWYDIVCGVTTFGGVFGVSDRYHLSERTT